MELGKRPWENHEQGYGRVRVRVSRLRLHKGYQKLEPTGAPGQELPARKPSSAVSIGPQNKQRRQQHQRRKWGFRIRPKVRVLSSTISRLVRRLRDSYVRVMRAMAASARDKALLSIGASKKKPRSAIGTGSFFRYGSGGSSNFSGVETEYMDYIRRTVTDGELSYYIMSLRRSSIV